MAKIKTKLELKDIILNLILNFINYVYIKNWISEETASDYANWHSSFYK